ncbi:MAG: sulfatase, partial [Planctomycetes bacterium]|nr:sulfatase [Planctomycetota bacterium]
YRGCVEDRWKLLLPADGKKAELYDILADPEETKNLAGTNAEVVTRLTRSINHWWPAK